MCITRNHLFIFVALVTTVALVSCGSFLRSNVITFYDGPLPSGETIRVQAIDPELNQSLEFRQYASYFQEKLSEIGYTTVAMNAESELIAEIGYTIDAGAPELEIGRGKFYSRYHFFYGRSEDPLYYGVYNSTDDVVYSKPTFVRELQLNIFPVDNPDERIFEGRVESTGYRNALPEIMPYLVSAMFSNFPGDNGVTKVVTIEMNE